MFMINTNIKASWRKRLPYMLILPALIFALVYRIYPIFYSFFRAFHYKGELSLQTYINLFQDTNFGSSFWITIKMNLVMIPLQIVISFILALLVNASLRGIGVFRSLYYLPVTISMPVAAICWSMILNYNSGVVNSIITSLFGVEQQGFFNDANQALWCVILLCTWKGCGYWMMFFLAGLKGIDSSLYEAATMDGAGFFRKLFSITIPMLRKTTLFVTVANTSINLLLFAPMMLITSGGPSGTTNVLMYEAYKQAFKYGNYDKGSAITSILVVLILVVVFLQFKLMDDKD